MIHMCPRVILIGWCSDGKGGGKCEFADPNAVKDKKKTCESRSSSSVWTAPLSCCNNKCGQHSACGDCLKASECVIDRCVSDVMCVLAMATHWCSLQLRLVPVDEQVHLGQRERCVRSLGQAVPGAQTRRALRVA